MEENKPDNANDKTEFFYSLEKVKKHLDFAADSLEASFFCVGSMKKNEKKAFELIRNVEENLKLMILLLRKMNEEVRKSRGKTAKAKPNQKAEPLTETEAKKMFPGRKTIVFYHNSDFTSLEEYIEYMRRPPIAETEVAGNNWDNFLDELNKWKGAA